MDAETVRQNILRELAAPAPSLTAAVRVEDTLPSTNTELCRMAKEGAPGGTVLIALSQSGGRGRMGRSFYSPAMTGLYISFLFRPRIPYGDLLTYTPSAAVFTARAVEKTLACPGEIRIKWVNDLFCRGRKVCGILTEGAVGEDGMPEYAVLGIGINLAPPPGGFPPELADIAGALLQDVREAEAIYPRLCACLIEEVMQGVGALPDKLPLEEYKKRCFFLGQPVTVARGEERIACRAVDIDERFRLITEDGDGVRTPRDSGEIRLKL